MFEKFADYWNKDNVFIDRIVYLPIVDATVRLANLKSGGLDLIERVLATDIKDVRADPRSSSSRPRSSSAIWASHQCRKRQEQGSARPVGKGAPGARPAIDREALNQVVFNGEFIPGNQWVSPENPYYQKAFPVPKRDVAKAKALLKEAGVALPVDVDLMVPKGAENEAVAEVIQSMAAEVGFDMKIRVTEFATSLKQAEAGEFQAFLIGWSGRIDPDGNSYVFLHTKAPLNDGVYSNPEVDKLLEEARLITDPAQRKAIYEKLTEILLRRRADHLSLSPQAPDRAHDPARGLSADAGRNGARRRIEAEMSVNLQYPLLPRRAASRLIAPSPLAGEGTTRPIPSAETNVAARYVVLAPC